VSGPGQESGHAGFSWDDYVDGLVAERGSLAAVAMLVAERRGFSEDAESVERGLRRLRARGARDGGVWGQRLLRCFGLPAAVADRVRWMGQYHTRFTDLPASLCEELLQPWDRPPVSESAARIWILLARLNLVLRRREDPEPLLAQAAQMAGRVEPAARAELALVRAFVWERSDRPAADRSLAEAREALEAVEDGDDRACLFARWVDQSAYRLNKPRGDDPPADHAGAAQLYRQIPSDGPLFARVRRENGLGWSVLSLGRREEAEQHALASVEAAGDSGSLRLRAMALKLLAAVRADDMTVLERARQIAAYLEDEALALRFRHRPR